MKKKICFLLDKKNNWLLHYCKKFININKKYNIKIFYNFKKIFNYDYIFVLGFTKILPSYFLQRNNLVMVIHESDLPKGKGKSPIQWQILDNKSVIRVNLIRLIKKLDGGDIILSDKITFNGSELYDEIRYKQAEKTLEIINKFLKLKKVKFKKQIGKETFFKSRSKVDSKLNFKASIKKNFNILRIANNKYWPAFFYHKGYKYTLKIFKEKI